MKKIILALFASILVCSAFANESLTSIGVGTPVLVFRVKEHYIFDNRLSLVADFGFNYEIISLDKFDRGYDYSGRPYYGYTYQDVHSLYLNFDIGAGYALVNRQKFKLVLSALAGIEFNRHKSKEWNNEAIGKSIAFDVGSELYSAFKFTQHFGAFLSLKVMYAIGKGKEEFKSDYKYDDSYSWAIREWLFRPSAGLVICF